jgi:iron(III) transport system ATP-binding protein
VTSPELRGMGMVFQNYAVWPHKTVYENIAFGLKLRKLASTRVREKVEGALALVNMEGLGHRYPNELSGGQQQRVALARSLVVEPDILLLDEPLSNLDAKLRERMRVELKQLQRRTGITFIYVTHDQAEALALSDVIALMHGGLLQQYGSPFEIYTRPVNRIVADFMGLVNFLPGRVMGRSEGRTIVEAEGGLRIIAAGPENLEQDDHVEIAVRPENIRLAPAAPDAMTGVVQDQTFLGNICEYMISLHAGPLLRVQTHPLQLFAPGDQVSVEIDAGQCSVFAARPNSQGS